MDWSTLEQRKTETFAEIIREKANIRSPIQLFMNISSCTLFNLIKNVWSLLDC